MRKFAISDIHGCLLTFKALLDKINFSTTDELYLLGDYIDRGPASKGVIDFIFELQESGHTLICMKGNHEDMLLAGIENSYDLEMWELNGGKATLKSFGANNPSQLNPKYLDFFNNLKLYVEVDRYLLVHAGFDFTIPPFLENKEAFLWQRRWYKDIDYDALGDRIVVHGHTPIPKEDILQQFTNLDKQQYLDIDNGCCYIRHASKDLAKLCAFDMTNHQIYFQENIDVFEV